MHLAFHDHRTANRWPFQLKVSLRIISNSWESVSNPFLFLPSLIIIIRWHPYREHAMYSPCFTALTAKFFITRSSANGENPWNFGRGGKFWFCFEIYHPLLVGAAYTIIINMKRNCLLDSRTNILFSYFLLSNQISETTTMITMSLPETSVRVEINFVPLWI